MGGEFSLSPRLGRQKPFDTDEDPVDESGGELSFTLERSRAILSLPLSLTVGVASSPQWFDDETPEHGLYGQLTLGDDYRPIHRLRTTEGDADASEDVHDALRPVLSYRYTRIYNDLLSDFARDEHEVAGGIRYRDVRTIMCEKANPGAANVKGACGDLPGISYVLRADVSRIWSSDPTETRLAPRVRGELVSHLLKRSIRLFGRMEYEWRFYDGVRVAGSGEKREERRLRAGAGIDLSAWADRYVKGLELELEAQVQRRWSNDPDRRHTRFYVIPALTFGWKFGGA